MTLRRRLSLLLLLLLATSGFPQTSHSPTAQPNIVLITLDTTRADRMGFLGSKRGLTPALDDLALQSVVFSQCFAQVPLTTPSHATILTGTYPQFHQVENLGDALSQEPPYLPAILRQHGYKTAAFIGGAVLDPAPGGAVGFQRGFDVYDADFRPRNAGEDRFQTVERRADTVVEHAISWLQKQQDGPMFLWVHLYDPHDPYDPPEPYKTRFASQPYDGEIAYTDSAVGKLLAALRKEGVFDQAVIAVMADHGEALGEHGEQTHGIFLYDETLHVPLLLKLPTGKPGGSTLPDRVGLVDVAPTLLQLVDIPVPAEMQGESLIQQMHSSPQPSSRERPLYAESQYGRDAYGWSVLRSWRERKYLYIQAPKRELYDQEADPQATKNLASQSRAVADTMASELENFRQRTRSNVAVKAKLSPTAVQKLRALGYVSSATSGKATDGEFGPDPKDQIEFANLMHSALIDVEEGQLQSAVPKLEAALKIDPQAGPTYLELGNDYLHLNDLEKALPALQKAVSLMPESATAHERLGEALVGQQNWPAAASEFEAAISRDPTSSDVHVYLGGVYEKLNRLQDATDQFEKAAQIEPQDFRANLLAGRMLGMHGAPQDALKYLQAAEALQPDSPDPHKFLANVYSALGMKDEAERERGEALRLSAAPK